MARILATRCPRVTGISGLGTLFINVASPHASPLRRLGLSTRNRVRNASYSSTGDLSPESDDCPYSPPPSSSSDIVITDRSCGDSPRASGVPSSSSSNTNDASDSSHDVACGNGVISLPPSPFLLNLSLLGDASAAVFATVADCTRAVVCPPLPAYLLPHCPLWRRVMAPRKTYIAWNPWPASVSVSTDQNGKSPCNPVSPKGGCDLFGGGCHGGRGQCMPLGWHRDGYLANRIPPLTTSGSAHNSVQRGEPIQSAVAQAERS